MTSLNLTPTILMHGSWGPQKNIELGLMTLNKLKREGVKFRLVISGGLNPHFPEYKRKFQELLHCYSEVIDEYLGPVTEKDIMKIFLDAHLLILPYNTPGGHSAVLEQAMFFEVPNIAIDFPEFREQANGTSNVKLVSHAEFPFALACCLESLEGMRKIYINGKIMLVGANIRRILDYAMDTKGKKIE